MGLRLLEVANKFSYAFFVGVGSFVASMILAWWIGAFIGVVQATMETTKRYILLRKGDDDPS